MRLIWTAESLNKLIEIENFIAEDNPTAAIDFIEYLITQAETILDNPLSGRVVPEFSNIEIRELIRNNYRIVYRVKNDAIEILTIFEAHRLIRRVDILKRG